MTKKRTYAVNRGNHFIIRKVKGAGPEAMELRVSEFEPIPLGIDTGCQWIRGIARERVFCGHTVKPGSAWCQHHYDRVWVQAS